MAQVELIIEDARWNVVAIVRLAQTACDTVLDVLALEQVFEIAILACDDPRIAALNESFRDKPNPTNVLSWPAFDLAPQQPGCTPSPPNPEEPELGDIAIAYDTCAGEAAEQGKPVEDHVTHLLVHGTLHLLGYDHETEADAALMEGLETRILAKLGVEDPY
ncbi:MAG: rRNA maturation RNase YbeY [Pseudomonadota bacterium]